MSDSVTQQSLVLGEANEIVYGERQRSYGNPAENHETTAALWSTYLGVKITSDQVCICNMLQKISREKYRHKHDNLVDIAGYAENAALCIVNHPLEV